MMTIAETLQRFGCFHDWRLDTMATQCNAARDIPDTFMIGLFHGEKRATIKFLGVTRVGIENGGLLNIVNAIEVIGPGSESYTRVQELLRGSAHGSRRAANVVCVFATVGAEVAIEFDSLHIESEI
ncbi:hypothetical protein [Paraburkholderia caballeronis]|uniref:hypothetical protein n=1 Tax=Paraburkholderia caballeronis TaxID=416943 RepID=UPI001065D7DA|nr:hypothetical protein [Paraburkholderia caballeronis]